MPADLKTMQTQTHPLIAPTLGTARNLTSFHYGPGGGQKIYIQSSLHADELPGMLVAWRLRKHLAALKRQASCAAKWSSCRFRIRSVSINTCSAPISVALKRIRRRTSTVTSTI